MAGRTRRTTIYLEPDLYEALRLKASETSRSVSDIINDAVKESLNEDAEDIAAFKERAEEPLISYNKMVTRLKKNGYIK